MYVYKQTEHAGSDVDHKGRPISWGDLWTVGFYTPEGKWEAESDHDTKESAAVRVHYLNGRE